MIALGKTGMMVSKVAIGTVPLQRLGFDESLRLVHRCFEGGVRYFDTSDNYGGSDAKLGDALRDVRHEVVISTKISPTKYADAKKSIEKSLEALKTDYIDLIQFHNPKRLPGSDDSDGAYLAALEAKNAGMVHHIGYTTHSLDCAVEAVKSGRFETVQYPLNYLSGPEDEALVDLSNFLHVGLIAMKPFAGGMIKEPDLTFFYFHQREHVVPIYGIQRDNELDILLELEKNPPVPNIDFITRFEAGRKQYARQFCRGCEFCADVCPVGIRVSYAGRIGDFFFRNPPQKYLKDDGWYKEIKKIEQCQNCGACVKKCRFGLDLRHTMKRSYKIFMDFWNKRHDYI